MKVRALVPLNHNDKTVEVDEIIELEDEVAAKTLIEAKAVEEVKETVAPVVGATTKVLVENKQGEAK
ncbi:MAG: hypothetical protein ACEQSQ_00195 [Candidatus Paceibacteria bacterium]